MTELFFSAAGRVARGRYWLITVAGSLLGVTLFLIGGLSDHPGAYVAYVAIIWPMMMVAVKRYHDRGKSGVWLLIVLIPFVGAIWQLVELGFLRGVRGPNEYGPDPLMTESESANMNYSV